MCIRDSQWGFGNDASTLQTPGVSNAASANPPSWDEKGGNMDGKEVVVAVLDSGIDASHPDLDGSIYRFSPAQQQALGCGELGYNAEAAANPALDAADVADRGNHGTHCAGIIAAEWDGSGTSGIASDAKLMVIKKMCIRDRSGEPRDPRPHGHRVLHRPYVARLQRQLAGEAGHERKPGADRAVLQRQLLSGRADHERKFGAGISGLQRQPSAPSRPERKPSAGISGLQRQPSAPS